MITSRSFILRLWASFGQKISLKIPVVRGWRQELKFPSGFVGGFPMCPAGSEIARIKCGGGTLRSREETWDLGKLH